MAPRIMTNVAVWLDGYDVSGDLNGAALQYGAELVDLTTFDKTTRVRGGGLKTVALEMNGLWESGTDEIDPVLFSRIGLADTPLLIGPSNAAADGERAFGFLANLGSYAPGGAVGEALAFQVSAEASGSLLVGGTIMHNDVRTGAGTGVGRQLGAVAAGQKLYAHLHTEFVIGGGSLTVTVHSDDAADFVGETTRVTHTGATGRMAEVVEVAGPITHTWWRVKWTLSGTSPSAKFIVLLGIH